MKKPMDVFSSLTCEKEIAGFALAMCNLNSGNVPIRYSSAGCFINFLKSCNANISTSTEMQLLNIMNARIKSQERISTDLITMGNELKHNHNYFLVNSVSEIPTNLGDGIHLISASHGTGKTQVVAVPFVSESEFKSLTICHLASLASDMATRFGATHYKDYRDTLGDISNHSGMSPEDVSMNIDNKQKVSICLNSIVLTLTDWVEQTGTLVIDEISQVLSTMATADYKGFNHLDIYKKMVKIIQSAKQIMVLDADLDDSVIQFLQTARPNEKFNIYECPRTDVGYKVEWCYGKCVVTKETATDTATAKILSALMDGKKIMVATNSKDKSESASKLIREQLPHKKVLTINQSTTKTADVKAFLRNPNNHADKYDVIIHSPSMQSGVSIDKVDFDMGFGIFSGMSIAPSDAIQMMRRARNITEWFISVDECNNFDIEDVAALHHAHNELSGSEVDQFDNFRASLEAKRAKGKNMFANALYHQLQAYKFTITHCEHRSGVIGKLSDISKNHKEEFRKLVVSAPVISDHTFDEMIKSEDQTINDLAIIESHKIKSFMCVDKLSDDLVSLWDDGRIRSRIKFNAAVSNHTNMIDDSEELSVSLRSFLNVKASIFRDIVGLTDINISENHGSIRPGDELNVLNFCWENRIVFAYLGIAPAKWTKKYTTKPACAKKFIKPLFEKFGVYLESKRSSSMIDGQKVNNRYTGLNTNKMELIRDIVDARIERDLNITS